VVGGGAGGVAGRAVRDDLNAERSLLPPRPAVAAATGRTRRTGRARATPASARASRR
jgi:hypothetical protein